MAQRRGYLTVIDPDKPLLERDTLLCGHCQRMIVLDPVSGPVDAGGFCYVCSRTICGPCADLGQCSPFEEKLKKIEDRDRFLRSAGLGA